MKRTFLFPMLVTVALFLGGCAMMSDEDKDFYGKGWIHPKDLDTETPHRAVPDPEHPATSNAADRLPVAPIPSDDAEPGWISPETRR